MHMNINFNNPITLHINILYKQKDQYSPSQLRPEVDEILTFHRDVNISHERSKCASKLRKQSALGP